MIACVCGGFLEVGIVAFLITTICAGWRWVRKHTT